MSHPAFLRTVSTYLLLPLGLVALGACGGDDDDDGDGLPTAAAGAGTGGAAGLSGAAGNVNAGAGTAGTSETPANGGTGGTPVASGGAGGVGGQPSTGETPDASVQGGVRLVGRMDVLDPAGPRFAWSGTGVVAEFSGTSAAIRLDDSGQNQFTVVIDGELAPKLVTLAGPNDYPLASELAPGTHRIEVYRRSEASFGPTQFLGFDFGADGQLLPPPAVTRRIEIIGDSVSTGYGNEGVLPCPFTPETQNHYLTYGAIAARALDAELSTVAWSGKGVVYNYDTDVIEPMPALYGRTLPQDPESTYDFAIVPDVVVVNLGTNDFSTEGDPTTEQFAEVYAGLLERVRAEYPDAFILGTVGPLLTGTDLTAAREGIAAGVAAFEANGGSNARAWEMNVPNAAPPGCDYHPNVPTHQAMADALIPELEAAFD